MVWQSKLKLDLLYRSGHVKETIKIMTYNVLGRRYLPRKGLNGHVNDENWKKMMKYIKEHQPDILVIQEAPTSLPPDDNIRKQWINHVNKNGNFSYYYIHTESSTVNVFSKYEANIRTFVTNTKDRPISPRTLQKPLSQTSKRVKTSSQQLPQTPKRVKTSS